LVPVILSEATRNLLCEKKIGRRFLAVMKIGEALMKTQELSAAGALECGSLLPL
jgi:hypothetical protein